MLLGLVISTHSTLDMPVILRGIHEDSLVTKQPCIRLSLSLGDKPVSGSSTIWGVTIGRVDSLLLPLAIDASSKYTVAVRYICKQGLQTSSSGASLIYEFELSPWSLH